VRARHWTPWLFAGGAALALVIALVATRSHSHRDAVQPPAAPTDEAPPLDDLQDIANQANAGDVEGARDKLDEYEDKYGETPASRDLRHQLDHLLKPPPGKHHKHD
jgi:hypothetical protein